MKHSLILLLICSFALALTGCAGSEAQPADEAEPVAVDTPAPATAPPADPELAASHVLIQFAGAQRAQATRTKEEALDIARDVAKRARAGEEFAELARQFSDGPSAPGGGSLGIFPASKMIPAFSEACMKMQIGDISDPVETEFGFHVIRRDPVEKVAARHILIMHAESLRKPPQVSRSKDEALSRSREVLAKLEGGDEFQALAREYSDGPSAPKGGDLGPFGRGAMVPAFDTAVFALEVGAVSDIVETPFGYHIIQRYQ